MKILVDGTAVIEWGEGPYEAQGTRVPFDVDDEGFLDRLPEGHVPHWDGDRWWSVPVEPTPSELSDAIAEVADLAAANEATMDDVVDALMELAELVGGERDGEAVRDAD